MPIVEAGGVRLHVETRGHGRPLLLVPGIPAVASDWFPFADRLAGTHRVIAYDNRGSGGSEAPPGPYTTAQLADDAAALLAALRIGTADVLGISMGGMIAQELALRHPARVRRLVLGCTQAATARAVQPAREVSRAFAARVDDWAERMRRLAPFAFAPDVDRAFLDAFVAKKSRDVQPEHGYRAQIAAVLAHDAEARLPEIAAPTLVITGDADQVIPAPNSEHLAARIPDATLHVLPGAGHLFFLEQPEATQRALEGFLAD